MPASRTAANRSTVVPATANRSTAIASRPAAASRSSTNLTTAYLTRYRSVAASSAEPAGSAVLPVTGAQRRFLLARRLDPQGRPDVVPLFFAFPRGTVDPARLHRAALRVAARHPALRGTFTTLRGTPVLRLGQPSAEVREVAVPPGATTDEALRRALLDWPAEGPALRLLLARGAEHDEELLAVALDHAACDEQSLGIVTAGLTLAYREDAPDALGDLGPQELAEAAAAYREAVELQLAAEAAAASPAAHAHWAARLSGLTGAPGGPAAGPGPVGSERPADPRANPTVRPTAARPTGPTAEQGTGMLSHRLLPGPGGAGRRIAFPALLDAVTSAAHRLFGPQRALALGYPWGGRPAAAPQVLGCFLNTLVHPATPGPATLDELSAAWWDDLDHADMPFDEVVHAARSAGAQWTGALDGLLTFEDLHRRPPLVLGGTDGRETHLAGRPITAPFAVSASHGDDLLVRLAWDRSHCTDEAADAAFDALLEALRHHLGD
ncbi:non-ribosomal peptide synthetase [Kitasatospora sp. NPDC056138]|uniref:non-ribosomal peptide synthetase n=1 Tax=Kitasatospora sp. NPDC056138 TaxID=3345724 RepID=UPI0035DE1343